MTDIKDILSRGWRNGEIAVTMSGQNGKSVIVDMETQGIEPEFNQVFMQIIPRDYWCHNFETDRWTFHRGRYPGHEFISCSDRVITRIEDGTFYWYKNRVWGLQKKISEEELKDLLFVFLSAEEVIKKDAEWVDVSNFRAKGASIGIKKIP